jgi:hypothetical protein
MDTPPKFDPSGFSTDPGAQRIDKPWGYEILLTPKGKPQLGYTEAQNSSRLVTDVEDVRILAAQYGSIRAQALTMQESLALIKKMLGEL